MDYLPEICTIEFCLISPAVFDEELLYPTNSINRNELNLL